MKGRALLVLEACKLWLERRNMWRKGPLLEPLRTEAKFRDAKDVSGIFDITGGLEASEYVRRMRGAGQDQT